MVEIVEVIRRFEQGFTEPYLCRCDDGNLYVVKGSNATYSHLAAEVLCGHLAKDFGLPIPDFSIISVPQAIIDSGVYPGLDIDFCFGSMFVEGLTEMVFSQVKLMNKQIMLDLYLFDYWIRNSDRTLTSLGGNPNVFMDISQRSLVIFDHNLAFDDDFAVEDHKQIHMASSIWNCEQARLDDKPTYTDRLDKLMDNFDEYANEIPVEWFDNAEAKASFIGNIKVILLSFKHDDFWEGLK